MPSTLLVDADILIDAARGVRDAADWLDSMAEDNRLAVSIVTEMELVVGCRDKRELRELDRSLVRFERIPIPEPGSALAVDLLKRYRLSHGLLIADALIAATAISMGSVFATKNQRHFRFIEGLNLLPYS